MSIIYFPGPGNGSGNRKSLGNGGRPRNVGAFGSPSCPRVLIADIMFPDTITFN